ncbi:MAG: isocitrate lyase/phosphoenolpyruvate mutase family protein [Lachnospiraceae bacterium]|nr:isocitrate lyase/phosphoenolpyruvate mutase family protein [Lachnospiraceae bacterium]
MQTLKQMLEAGQLFVPCVYDCMSAMAAERSGYKAVFLSGGAISYSQNGLPDMGFSTADEMIAISDRITDCTDLPLIVDADDGYGESPIVVYHTIRRLLKAGVQGFCLDDAGGYRGFERKIAAAEAGTSYTQHCISREAWLAKIKACVEACKGTDCVVIARTEVPDLHEAIERCIRARMLGAHMTLVCRAMRTLEDGRMVAKYDQGWKMWPDVYSVNGVPCVELEAVKELGFNLVTFHVFEKAALYGMLRYGMEMKEKLAGKKEGRYISDDPEIHAEVKAALDFHRNQWMDRESGVHL